MKEEILMYYPELNSATFITGSSQFIPYFDNSKKYLEVNLPRGTICHMKRNGYTFREMMLRHRHDQYYLKDLGEAVQRWNLYITKTSYRF